MPCGCDGAVDTDMLNRLSEGVELDDGLAHFEQIIDAGGSGSNHWYHVIIKEGRNREVRRLWEAVGVEVSRLIRVRYDQFNLPKWLKPGKYRFLDDEVVKRVYRRLGLTDRKQEAESRAPVSRKRSRKKVR